eukprot:10215180-Lingulodinium_polyedra.AAC.1
MRHPAWASLRSPLGRRRPRLRKAHASPRRAAPWAALGAGTLCMVPPLALPGTPQAPRPPGTS